jgi:hypothetical protein
MTREELRQLLNRFIAQDIAIRAGGQTVAVCDCDFPRALSGNSSTEEPGPKPRCSAVFTRANELAC